MIGDERRLKQVLINLSKNALKFTTNGAIKIYACYEAVTGTLTVSVEDSGRGIKNNELPLLFTKFGKLQRTAEMNSGGIGLGLTIVKQIVEQSQGRVLV